MGALLDFEHVGVGEQCLDIAVCGWNEIQPCRGGSVDLLLDMSLDGLHVGNGQRVFDLEFAEKPAIASTAASTLS